MSPAPPPGRKKLITFVAAVLLVLYGVYFQISRFCNSIAFFCRSDSEMYHNAEKTKAQENTLLLTIKNQTFPEERGIFLAPPGFGCQGCLSRQSFKG